MELAISPPSCLFLRSLLVEAYLPTRTGLCSRAKGHRVRVERDGPQADGGAMEQGPGDKPFRLEQSAVCLDQKMVGVSST